MNAKVPRKTLFVTDRRRNAPWPRLLFNDKKIVVAQLMQPPRRSQPAGTCAYDDYFHLIPGFAITAPGGIYALSRGPFPK